MKVYAMHNRFKNYWSEYENKDIYKVCEVMCRALKAGKVNHIEWCKRHWSQVCNFLIQWEGK